MSDLYKIYVDFAVLGYQEVEADVSSTNIVKTAITRTINRTSIEGTIKFKGDYYYLFNTRRLAGYNKLNIKVQEKHGETNVYTDLWEGTVAVNGKYDADKAICELTISGIKDTYYNFFEATDNNWETEFDIGEIERTSILYDRDIDTLEWDFDTVLNGASPKSVPDWFDEWAFDSWPFEPSSDNSDLYLFATQKSKVLTAKKSVIIGSQGWQDTGETSGDYTIIARKSQDTGFTSSVKDSNWFIASASDTLDPKKYIDGNFYTIDDILYYCIGYIGGTSGLDSFAMLNYDEYYGRFKKPLSRLFDFKTTVEYIVNEIDSTVIVNDAETWAGFFDKTGNEEMQTLAILHAWDLSENNQLLQEYKDDKAVLSPASRSGEIEELENKITRLQPKENPKISFKSIVEFFENSPLNVFWYLKESGGNTYLKFEHVTDINNSDSGINLQSYLGKNWVENQNSIESLGIEISLQERESDSLNIDHIGDDIIYSDAPSLKSESTSLNFITDIQGKDSIAAKIDLGWFIMSLENIDKIITYIDNYSLLYSDFTTATIDDDNKIVLQDAGTSVAAMSCELLEYSFASTFTLTFSFNANLVNASSLVACVISVLNEDGTEEYPSILTYTITQGYNEFTTDLNLGQVFQIAKMSIGFRSYANGDVDVEITDAKYTYKDVERSEGVITGLTKANNKLSISSLDDKYIGNCDFPTAKVNGSTKNNLNLRLRTQQSNDISVPVVPLFSSFDFDDYYTSNIGKCIITKQTRPMSRGFDKLSLVINENL